MGWKHKHEYVYRHIQELLIEPTWDGNRPARSRTAKTRTSNRTNMGWKQSIFVVVGGDSRLLIEPTWDGNSSRTRPKPEKARLLIEPTWDGNLRPPYVPVRPPCPSNRTNMGWKRVAGAGVTAGRWMSSNRTNMGWKLALPHRRVPPSHLLIEPTWDGNMNAGRNRMLCNF
jgi:hypothetical protein